MKTVRMMVGSVVVAFAAFADAFESLAAETTLPTPTYVWQFSSSLNTTPTGTPLSLWNETATYCKVHASYSANAFTKCSPYATVNDITNYVDGLSIAMSAMPPPTQNALLIAFGRNNLANCFGLASYGENKIAVVRWNNNTAHDAKLTVDVPELNTKQHSFVLTLSSVKMGAAKDRDVIFYVDGAEKGSSRIHWNFVPRCRSSV